MYVVDLYINDEIKVIVVVDDDVDDVVVLHFSIVDAGIVKKNKKYYAMVLEDIDAAQVLFRVRSTK